MESNSTVWVVDDDPDDHFLIQRAFGKLTPPVQLRPFFNGQELMSALAQESTLPRLVLLDLNMPGMSGFEVLRLVRAGTALQYIPIVVLTTSQAEADKQKSINLGASDFCMKPSDEKKLDTFVSRWVHNWSIQAPEWPSEHLPSDSESAWILSH